MIKIKKTHETQSTEKFSTDVNDQELYTPIENLQKIEAGGVYKRDSFNVSRFPKGIRYLSYFLIGAMVLMFVGGMIIGFLRG